MALVELTHGSVLWVRCGLMSIGLHLVLCGPTCIVFWMLSEGPTRIVAQMLPDGLVRGGAFGVLGGLSHVCTRAVIVGPMFVGTRSGTCCFAVVVLHLLHHGGCWAPSLFIWEPRTTSSHTWNKVLYPMRCSSYNATTVPACTCACPCLGPRRWGINVLLCGASGAPRCSPPPSWWRPPCRIGPVGVSELAGGVLVTCLRFPIPHRGWWDVRITSSSHPLGAPKIALREGGGWHGCPAKEGGGVAEMGFRAGKLGFRAIPPPAKQFFSRLVLGVRT